MNPNLESLNDMVGRLTEMAKSIGWQEPPVVSGVAPFRCEHCGHQGEDVHMRGTGKLGDGKPIPLCDDQTACWTRWDKQHGIDMEVLTK